MASRKSDRPKRPSVRPTVSMKAVHVAPIDECPVCKGKGVVSAEIASAVERFFKEHEE